MMKTKNSSVFAIVLATMVVLVGCREEPAVASPACADFEKVIDPTVKAALLKKCPRSGPEFKPSPEKKW
jgi:entry exclusion lipoprotein TrbK